MCGIAGFFLKHKSDREDLVNMTRSLQHRGPDSEGFFEEDRVGLGHRRLSIIDLKTGGQPIFNEDGSTAVIYNGEIYNFKELKKSLVEKGHIFQTSSDTEVLVHLYEEFGELFPEKLNGIFAFALYDRKKKLLILARDQTGVKPLYYAKFDKGLLFASEIKAMLRFRDFHPAVDSDALPLYLQMEYYPAPLTPYREVKKLLPGHILVVRSPDMAELKKYHEWDFDDLSSRNTNELIEETRQTVIAAVKSQLVSDVPLGVFLSGGIDSSSVAAAMKLSGAEVNSFSIGFEHKDFDESASARSAANHLGTTHAEKIFTEKELLQEVPSILSELDEPLADPSIFPTALLARFARQNVTVALGGDGGDELFCGYPTYIIHKLFPFYKYSPPFLRKPLLSFADSVLPVNDGNLTFSYKLRKFMDGAEKEMPERHFAWMGAFNREKLKRLMPGARFDFSPLSWMNSPPQKDRVADAEWLDLQTYLMEDVLQKVDRMSMLSSLEVRVPLLDRSVIKLAFSIPSKCKLHGFHPKYILKKAFERDLPEGHFDRPKKGFAIPISRWLKGPLKEQTIELFSNVKAPFFDSGEPMRLLNEHLSGKRDNRKLIWTIFVFLWWFRARNYESKSN
jgi:asparagine synthase (glutamine-hydrolysing)